MIARHALHFGARTLAGVAALFLAVIPAPAKAEYRLAVGDVIDISIFGIPELRSHAKVNMDGEVPFPLVGEISVAGLTVPEVRTQLQQRLTEQVLGHNTGEGRDPISRIGSNEIVVEVAEYRPVYISGDVVRSGEQPFRPGLTVRQLISLAGGYDDARGKATSPNSDPNDLRAEYNALWIDFAREQAHVGRLEAALDRPPDNPNPQLGSASDTRAPGSTRADSTPLYNKLLGRISDTPLPKDFLMQIAKDETDQHILLEADYTKEHDYLVNELGDTDHRLAFVSDEEQKARSEVELDMSDLGKIRALYSKGIANMDRLAGERHAVFMTVNQLMQTTMEVAKTKAEHDELARKLGKLPDDRRLGLVRELEDADTKLATLRGRLQAASEKLSNVGAGAGSEGMREAGIRPSVVVFRRTGNVDTKITASEDATLLPGDVIEVITRPATATE